MAPEAWTDAEGATPSDQPSTREIQLDRQMIRHLLARYGQNELVQLLQEEGSAPNLHNDAASVITSSTHSSVKSEDVPSVFDSASSVRSMPLTASSRSSILSHVSTRTSKLLGRRSLASIRSAPAGLSMEDESPWEGDEDVVADPNDPAAAAAGAAKQKGTFMCGFCSEEGIQKTCTRKNDLKRHIEDFHNMDAQWFCGHRGCQMVFDWQTAYKTHLKLAHGGSRMSLDEARVDLCPQTVFACGFDNCTQIFEASSDEDAPSTFKDFVAHVIKHFDEGSTHGEWTYSTRIRNLLGQSGVQRAWSNSSWPESERNQLCWQTQSSGILRKRLETRHVGDLQLLVQYAVALGSNPSLVQKYREDFVTPLRAECREFIQGHNASSQPQPPPQPQPLPMSIPQSVPEGDPFQFKISRGSNPSLAAYMASQRRMYAIRPPVRTGRSARPPARTLNSNSHPQTPTHTNAPMGAVPYGYNAQSAAMFATRPQQQQPQPQQQYHPHHGQPQQQYGMMPQVMGGIVADDIRSFRNMAEVPGESDMDMTDAQMMDPSFMAQQNSYAGSYGGSTGMQTSGAADMTSPTMMAPQELPFGFQNGS